MTYLRTTIIVLVLAAAALALPGSCACAKTPSAWVERHYTSLDGLPVNSANDAAIDADGFLWLATHDGLVRFDGEHFEIYDSMRVPVMSGNRVQGLYKDRAGRLYALTQHGDWLRIGSGRVRRAELGVDSLQDARFVDRHSRCVAAGKALHCPDGSGAFPEYVKFPPRVNVAMAARGLHDTVWMVTRACEIWLYRRHAWQRVWRAKPGQNPSLLHSAVVGPDGALWTDIRTSAVPRRVLRVDLDGTTTWLAGDDDPLGVVAIRRGANDRIRVGAANGVFVLHAGQPRRVFVDPDVAPAPGTEDSAYASWRAPDGALWVARNGRLWRVPAMAGKRATIPPPVLVSRGRITKVAFGPGKLVWVTTLYDGIYRLNRPRVDLLGRADGLAVANVYSVTRDAGGSMWLGTLGHGVLRVSPDGQARHYGVADGLPGNYPWLVASAPDGSLYAATYGPGLSRLAAGSQRFEPVDLPAALRSEPVRAVTFDAAGQLWIGTTDGAWRRRAGRWQRVWPAASRRLTVFAIALTDHGAWFATNQGVWCQRDNEVFPVAAKLLGHTTVRNVRFTRDGALWASTVGHGLVRVAANDPKGLRPLQLGRARGLPSNSPHTIREDAKGNIWVNSNQGIFRISPDGLQALLAGRRAKLSPLQLGRADGLTELEGNGGLQPAAAWDARGRLWFPSQAGVVRFDPLAIHPRGEPPHPVITGVASEGRNVVLADDGSLPLGVRNLRINYAEANLFGSGKSRFRYRLVPQAEGWTATTVEHSAVFTALPPGRYRFELLAANSDGVWTPKPSALQFQVPAYWYETGALRLAAVAVMLLLLVLVVRWRMRRLRQHAHELDDLVRQQTLDLRQANAALERAASHDFLTGLPNRRAFVKSIDAAIGGDGPLALAILDIDFFKAYNDSLGHLAGDRCLEQFGALLKARGAVPGVLASRVGGEEFALLFEGEEVAGAGATLDALMAALRKMAITHPASAVSDRISFSAGLAERGRGDARAEDLIRRADAALYRAKEQGRDGWARAPGAG